MTGKIYLVGIGPGNPDDMTPRAARTIKDAAVVIGHKYCLELIGALTAGKEIVAGELSPVKRAEIAVQRALAGVTVAIVTTGDPGVYAIASTLFSFMKQQNLELDVVVVPGLPAANVASALAGSPLGHDFATISLADRAEPWSKIRQRLESAAEADFVIVLYNPKGKVGDTRLKEAIALLGGHFKKPVPVAVVTDMGGIGEAVKITTLDRTLSCEIHKQSVVIIGNSRTFIYRGRMVTPRDYIEGVGY